MINLTILGQMIACAIFVLFVMKFIWPPFIGAINERQRKIEEGLNAAEKARSDLASTEAKIEEQFVQAKTEANDIIERANKTAAQMIEDAKVQARLESERIITSAHNAVEQERVRVRETLQQEVAELAVLGAARILEDEINEQKHNAMLVQLAKNL